MDKDSKYAERILSKASGGKSKWDKKKYLQKI
jgi:hypothetical protein